jgi:hypothetical protein
MSVPSSAPGTVDDASRMTQWEAHNARSGYRVRPADGKWHDVPNFALIDPKTNKLGYAVVWLLPRTSARARHDLIAKLGWRRASS